MEATLLLARGPGGGAWRLRLGDVTVLYSRAARLGDLLRGVYSGLILHDPGALGFCLERVLGRSRGGGSVSVRVEALGTGSGGGGPGLLATVALDSAGLEEALHVAVRLCRERLAPGVLLEARLQHPGLLEPGSRLVGFGEALARVFAGKTVEVAERLSAGCGEPRVRVLDGVGGVRLEVEVLVDSGAYSGELASLAEDVLYATLADPATLAWTVAEAVEQLVEATPLGRVVYIGPGRELILQTLRSSITAAYSLERALAETLNLPALSLLAAVKQGLQEAEEEGDERRTGDPTLPEILALAAGSQARKGKGLVLLEHPEAYQPPESYTAIAEAVGQLAGQGVKTIAATTSRELVHVLRNSCRRRCRETRIYHVAGDTISEL